jgi:hypothetical protein
LWGLWLDPHHEKKKVTGTIWEGKEKKPNSSSRVENCGRKGRIK